MNWIRRITIFLTAVAVMFRGSIVAGGHVPAAVRQLQSVGELPGTNRLALAFGLPLRNKTGLTNLLEALSDPRSPLYHQYLTPQEFAAQYGPAESDYESLKRFLSTNGLQITGIHSNRLVLDAAGSVADVERLLQVKLRLYPHPTEHRNFFAPDREPAIDAALPILHISGLDNYVLPHPMNLRPASTVKSPSPTAGSGPGGSYLGGDFRAAYLPGCNLTGAGQAVGLLEFDGFYPSDVAAYRNLAGLPAAPIKTVLLDGFNGAPGSANAEVSLDIDMANDLAPGLAAIIVYEGEVTDDVLNRMATDNQARQLSASWLYPIDPETEQIFQEFAAQGQSFFNAAGDADAYGDGVQTPADDPYITIVGGTTLSTAGPGGAWVAETVWNWGNGTGTGGGTSTTYPIPAWQQTTSMASNGGSTTMRNLPDVAMVADNVWLAYDNGANGIFGGTSCATPLWAAFTALVNQQAGANGRPMQGFINPAVYALGNGVNYSAAFHDITTGNNTGPNSPTEFYAVPGYDLCTGWGTPAGTNLINLLAPPDPLVVSPAGGFTFSGKTGGPFTASWQTFVLTNMGSNGLNWSAGDGASWLNVSPSSGSLAAGASTSVTLSLNASASNKVVGSYGASVWFTNLNDGFAQARAFGLNIIVPPKITLSPTNQTVQGGATVLLTCAAVGGEPLSFQWRQNGVNLTDGGNLSGSSTTTLLISNAGPTNSGAYTVVVTNAAGAATNSPPAVLTVVPTAPIITVQPASQFALLGQAVNLTVSAAGSVPLAYQWKCNSTNLSDGANLSGSSTASLSIASAAATNSGTYTVAVSNSIGVTPSAGAVLTVEALADSQLLQNGGFETGDFSFWSQSGNSVFDTVGISGLDVHSGLYGAEMGAVGSLGYLSQTVPTVPGNSYLLSFWIDSPDGDGPNEVMAAWGGYGVMDLTNLPAVGWTNFQMAVTATTTNTTLELGVRDDTSFLGLDDVSLQPLANPAGAPVITAQPASQTYSGAGATVTLIVGAVGQIPLAYQWQSNGAPLLGATNASLVLSSLSAAGSVTYSVVVSNALGATTSSNAMLFVLAGNAALVTFDDLTGTNPAVPTGYANLNWSNFYYIDSSADAINPSGYIAGTVSQPNVVYNGNGTAASVSSVVPFDFLFASFTAAWNDGLRLEIKGYASNALVFDNAFSLSASNPTEINVNCIGVTNLEFISSGGTPDPAYADSGFEFVMDNASIIASPLPAPANDQCAGAILISSDPYTNSEFTVGATSTGDPSPSCAPTFTNGVWYQYTAPGNGFMQFDTTGSDYATALAVYTGACGSLTQVACEPAGLVPVTGGTTYYILVGALGDMLGTLVFHASFSSATEGPPVILAPPANATVLFGGSATFAVSATGAPPLTYIWKRNGVTVATGTATSYSANNLQLSDSGGQISCVVSNALGVAVSAPAELIVTLSGQLVQNGGFETGDFTGWALSGNTNDVTVNTMFIHSGQYGASLGPAGTLGYLSQNLATAPGRWYALSLWVDSPAPAGQFPNEFSVSWNGVTLADQVDIGPVGWTNLVFTVPATSSNTMLQFGFRDDPSFLGLDDISVVPLNPALQNVRSSGSALSFSWNAAVGSAYEIQYSGNLAKTNWVTIGTVTATNIIMTTSEAIVPTNSPQFFRIVTVP